MTLSYIPSDTNDEGVFKATASGVLPNGKPVIVNADGTVSVVEQTSVSFNAGTSVTYQSSQVDRNAAAYDVASGKVVVIYNLTSGDCYGIVGTVSGTSISFGSSTLFYDKSLSEIDISYDSTSSKVIVTYKDDYFYSYGAAVVGTVSGTSISFGTRTYFYSNTTNVPKSAFDSTNGKVVILFNSSGDKAVLGQVSGTSISFETAVTNSLSTGTYSDLSFIPEQGCFLAAGSSANAGVITVSGSTLGFGSAVSFASSVGSNIGVVTILGTSRAMIVYEDNGNSSILTGRVGTVSGTSVTLGSATVLDSNAAGNTALSAVYDEQAQAVMVVYTDYVNSAWGTYTLTASVSGDTITANSPNTLNATEEYRKIFPVYDTANSKVVVTFFSVPDSRKGKAQVITNAANPTNLTAENYIGMSTGGTYASGSTATVKIIGNTSNEQTSLTAGQAYYVQTDGTIGTTPADPSVLAGTAVSATKMVVKS